MLGFGGIRPSNPEIFYAYVGGVEMGSVRETEINGLPVIMVRLDPEDPRVCDYSTSF